MDGWTNWETKEAYNWLASSGAGGRYLEAKEEAEHGIYRFLTWAEDTLTRMPEWDDKYTEEVDFYELMEAVLDEGER